MRAVQAYIKLNNSAEYIDQLSLLIWKVSVLQNKALGLTTVFYGSLKDEKTLFDLKILDLYDEVYLLDLSKNYTNIDFNRFWAAAKIIACNEELARRVELLELDTDSKVDSFFIQDIDLIIKSEEVLTMLEKNEAVFWAPDLDKTLYPKLKDISLVELTDNNDKFKIHLPEYFKDSIIPVNTAIIKAPNNVLQDWVTLCFKYINTKTSMVITDKNIYSHSKSVDMITVEQLFLSNILIGKYKISPFIITMTATQNTKSIVHAWGIKAVIKDNHMASYPLIKTYLNWLEQLDANQYLAYIAEPKDDVKFVLDNWDAIKAGDF